MQVVMFVPDARARDIYYQPVLRLMFTELVLIVSWNQNNVSGVLSRNMIVIFSYISFVAEPIKSPFGVPFHSPIPQLFSTSILLFSQPWDYRSIPFSSSKILSFGWRHVFVIFLFLATSLIHSQPLLSHLPWDGRIMNVSESDYNRNVLRVK